MVGFGFMDNIIMIQAGELIDETLGVTIGLSTLTAAAMGNVCSDSSGVLFGGFVESAVARLNLSEAKLTAGQLAMRATRAASVGGALLGVICGCLLGSTSLLFMDLDAAERLKRAAQLETMFGPVMSNCQDTVDSERCTLFLFDRDTKELWTRAAVGGESAKLIRLPLDANALVCHAARTNTLLNISDVSRDPRWDARWDQKTGYQTKQVLCFPIQREGVLYGVLQAVNKKGGTGFTEADEKFMRTLASHIVIFVDAVIGEPN